MSGAGQATAMDQPGTACARHPHRPASEHCDSCGDWICESCATLACEAQGCPRAAPPGQGWALPVPWEQGRRLGWLRAFVQTEQRIALQPHRFFRDLPLPGDLALPLVFAATSFSLGAGLVLTAVALPDLPGAVVPLLILLSSLPFLGIYRAVGMGGLIWAGLAVLDGQARPLRGVLRITCYSLGADLLLPLAGLGVYLGAALQALALRRAWGVPWWKAILVASLPLVLFHLLVLGALALYLALTGSRF